jgi:phosphoadenosine phosphosulfate reductase
MQVADVEKSLKTLSLAGRLGLIRNHFAADRIVFSTSFGQEDQAITHAIATEVLDIEIFTLDTGRQFQESYELIDLTTKKYGIALKTYFPTTQKIEEFVAQKGFNSFYQSVENRKECCFIRKIEPLNRALEGAHIWITGLRAEQSDHRSSMPMLEWDEAKNIFKFNIISNAPLLR